MPLAKNWSEPRRRKIQIIYPLDDGRNFKGCCALELEFGRSTAPELLKASTSNSSNCQRSASTRPPMKTSQSANQVLLTEQLLTTVDQQFF
jgi:hypothetical protein